MIKEESEKDQLEAHSILSASRWFLAWLIL
jgi:hypothetical protein